MRRTVLSVVTLGALLAAACGGGSESSDKPTALPVATLAPTTSASSVPQTTAVSVPVTSTAAAPTPSEATPSATPNAVTPAATNPAATSTPGSDTPPPTPTPAATSGNPLSASVGVTGTARYFWSPASVKIAPGGTVTFSWSGTVPHDLKVAGIGFASAPAANASHTLTFPTAGTYQVICIVHEDTMKGTVTVQ